MKTHKIEEFIRGWVVGNFDPSIIKTNDVEVAYQVHLEDEKEDAHYHKIATEITIVVEGKVRMNSSVYFKGDIIVLSPGEVTDFESLTDSACLVIKYPGASNDKYLVENDE